MPKVLSSTIIKYFFATDEYVWHSDVFWAKCGVKTEDFAQHSKFTGRNLGKSPSISPDIEHSPAYGFPIISKTQAIF